MSWNPFKTTPKQTRQQVTSQSLHQRTLDAVQKAEEGLIAAQQEVALAQFKSRLLKHEVALASRLEPYLESVLVELQKALMHPEVQEAFQNTEISADRHYNFPHNIPGGLSGLTHNEGIKANQFFYGIMSGADTGIRGQTTEGDSLALVLYLDGDPAALGELSNVHIGLKTVFNEDYNTEEHTRYFSFSPQSPRDIARFLNNAFKEHLDKKEEWKMDGFIRP